VVRAPLAALLAALALAPPAAAGLTRSEAALLAQINKVRVAYALKPLHFDPRLERAARYHSRQMLASDRFSHGNFAARLARFAIAVPLAGENLAWVSGSNTVARSIVAAWLASPEHRANLLRPVFSRIGVAQLDGAFQGHQACVVTADFAG
jgi:uncharacterized protein YkwD